MVNIQKEITNNSFKELAEMSREEERLIPVVKELFLYHNTKSYSAYESIKDMLPALPPDKYNKVIRIIADVVNI